MAEPAPEDAYLGEFRRGPAIFTVFALDKGHRIRVDCNDGNGPSEVCVFSDRPGSGPDWHGAWNGDEWCAWIELQARKIARLPLPQARARRPAGPLSLMSMASPCPSESPARPAPPRDRTAGHRPGRSVGIGRASLPGNLIPAGELL